MAEQPTSGRLDAGRHAFPLRVYYEDTDAAGIVYYANYLRFAERARTEMMRAAGTEHGRLMGEAGVLWAVRRCTADYLSPARLDDRLEVVSTVVDVGAARLDLMQAVWRRADGTPPEELARLSVRLACIDRVHGRATRLPPVLRTALEALVTPQSTL
ncbi:acyl-CoA thioester hydrolase [Stella humosa]|uniref:Acyl-CoA thioester hydrolase n=1 Tax=Stella humosa TaxID=94 RepID=A0A3N1LKN7_9PROT|nr:YbgC/FadM family acyl-CoA thioesterase [Stella humosa]ROP91299.1 acyl-CoA thioester hydrolase [Stella humosa]BBK34346.1 thioesterase [Stella humosa]